MSDETNDKNDNKINEVKKVKEEQTKASEETKDEKKDDKVNEVKAAEPTTPEKSKDEKVKDVNKEQLEVPEKYIGKMVVKSKTVNVSKGPDKKPDKKVVEITVKKDQIGAKVANNTQKKKGKKGIITTIVFLFIILFIFYLWLSNKGPSLDVKPQKLNFTAEETVKSINIQNIVSENNFFQFRVNELNYKVKINKGDDWLSVNPGEGISSGEKKKINVSINREKLALGNNEAKFIIASNGGDKVVNVSAIREKDSITLKTLSPNSTLEIGKEKTIGWKASFGVSNKVNISLFLNDCEVAKIAKDYKYRSDNKSPGSYEWHLGESLLPGGSGYTLRIEDAANKEIFDQVSPISIRYPITKMRFENISATHQVPSKVQYVFSLRDQYNHAVLIDPVKLEKDSLRIWENKEHIDYLESHPLLSTQDDFQLQVMLVLDFSASMKRNIDGVKTMIVGAKALIDSLRETHEIGVIEFHRPFETPGILQPFMTNKQSAKDAIDNFVSTSVYSDFSICWDAVYKGMELYPTIPDPSIFRTLVFLSDGFDNSSTHSPDELIALGNERDIHVYIIGVGDVHDEKSLQKIADKTGGTYVHAENICVLFERFENVIEDLGGQYKLSYMTPKQPEDGVLDVKIKVNYAGVTSYPALDDKVDPALIFGETRRGVLAFTASPSSTNGNSEIFMWGEYIPRYINEFHFKLTIAKPFTVSLTSTNEGGLCKDWSITNEGGGWFSLKSSDQAKPTNDLEFSASGTICKIVVEGLTDEGSEIPFVMDNSVYKLGQSFYGGDDSEIDETGNWSTSFSVGK